MAGTPRRRAARTTQGRRRWRRGEGRSRGRGRAPAARGRVPEMRWLAVAQAVEEVVAEPDQPRPEQLLGDGEASLDLGELEAPAVEVVGWHILDRVLHSPRRRPEPPTADD